MRKAVWIALVAIALAAAPVAASTFVAKSSKAMVRDSDAVVRGEVLSVASAWSDSGRLIYTDARVAVHERLVGDLPQVVTVRVAGGQVGDYVVEAHGFPQLQEGERVVLFLDHVEGDRYGIVGYQQGHFRVVTRLDGVTLAVPQVDEGARLLDMQGRLAPEPRATRLEDFEMTVRDLARQVGRDQQTAE